MGGACGPIAYRLDGRGSRRIQRGGYVTADDARAALQQALTGGRATGAPRNAPRTSPRPGASTICATRSPPSGCAPDSGTYELSCYMGTSLINIDRTYGHLARDSHRHAIQLLDGYSRGCRDGDVGGRSVDVGTTATPVSATTEAA